MRPPHAAKKYSTKTFFKVRAEEDWKGQEGRGGHGVPARDLGKDDDDGETSHTIRLSLSLCPKGRIVWISTCVQVRTEKKNRQKNRLNEQNRKTDPSKLPL